MKRVPRPCAECGTDFIPPRPNSKFCSVTCRRAVDSRVCRHGHDLTLPGATRAQKGRLSRCVECEREATKRYRRKKGVAPRNEFLASTRKTQDEKRATKRANSARARRKAGVAPRTHTVRTEPRPIPTELSRAWGRASHGSQMKRKFPTREALVAAYQRGEVPDPPSARLEE